MTGILRVPRRAALSAISVLVASASAVSFAESYRGLYVWSHEHGLHGLWAVAWPVQVDTFIAVGELALFVALADRWAVRSRLAAWAVTLLGLAVSVAGNVGHVAGHSLSNRATAAIPPLAAAAALAVGLGVLKRVVQAHHAVEPDTASKHEHAGGARPAVARRAPQRSTRRAEPATEHEAELAFSAVLAEGHVPSLRQVKTEMHVGTDRARVLRDHLAQLQLAPVGGDER
jgi:Protein of unknown function (DUF2637)